MKYITYLILFFSFYVKANQITICKSCKVTTLKKAFEIAKEGDTLYIKKGIYKEYDLKVLKGLTVIGEKGVVIDGDNKGEVLTISAKNVTVKNIKIVNVETSYIKDNAALKIINSESFKVDNLTLKNIFFGILIERSKKGIISNNTILGEGKDESSSGNGIHIWHSSEIEVKNNTVSGMRDGIYFEFVKDSNIYNNLSYENIRYGLHFMFSNNDVYYKNEFRNNGAGVAVMFSKFITMYKNKFLKNWGSASYGLLLKEIYDAEVYENIFEENTIGINGEGSTRINYKNNIFLRNGWAVKITGACYQNHFKENDFLHNSLDLSYNARPNDNKFENNYWSEYAGYDLNKDGIGDVPYRPVNLFSFVVNQTPEALVLLRSLFVDIINFSEKVTPIFTPANLVDEKPLMKPVNDNF